MKDCTPNDIIDSLFNPSLPIVVVGHVTPLQDQEGTLFLRSHLVDAGRILLFMAEQVCLLRRGGLVKA